jgi:adenylate kinase
VRLLLIGPPGCGKGTQAARIANHYGVEHISSGDLLRRHVTERTSIGRAAEQFLNRGDLVPDGVVMDILRKPVEAASRNGGYILDGFPRTVAQAEAAYDVARTLDASVRIALHLQVPRDELIHRLLARGLQTGRADDTATVINHRLQVFDAVTVPLLDYYARRETLVQIDGNNPVPEVTRSAITHLDHVRRRLGLQATTGPELRQPAPTSGRPDDSGDAQSGHPLPVADRDNGDRAEMTCPLVMVSVSPRTPETEHA